MTQIDARADSNGAVCTHDATSEPQRALRWIEPRSGWLAVDWRELWLYRELMFFLSWRDVKVRYKQTVLGAAWAVLQPLMTTLVFTVLLGRLAGLNQRTDGTPYSLYVYAGLLPWMLFANAASASSSSLIGSANLVTKVYFPRLIIPFGSMGAGVVDFAVGTVVLAVMLLVHGSAVHLQIALAPLFVLAVLLLTAGVGAVLSALTVSYRDFQYVVPFTIQLWMYVTPVMYPASIVPERWRWFYYLNPMAGLVEGFRAAVLGRPIPWPFVAVSVAVSCVVFALGVSFFRNVERRFADVI